MKEKFLTIRRAFNGFVVETDKGEQSVFLEGQVLELLQVVRGKLDPAYAWEQAADAMEKGRY